MNKKLTLNINQSVIAKAKNLANRNKTTVSKLVEDFLIKTYSQRELSIVDTIIKNAPANKTKKGIEKNVLLSVVKEKYRM